VRYDSDTDDDDEIVASVNESESDVESGGDGDEQEQQLEPVEVAVDQSLTTATMPIATLLKIVCAFSFVYFFHLYPIAA
jgi:flagellar motor switch/type III secretory pathway protein FliN